VVDSSYGVFAVCGSGGSEGEMWLIRVMVFVLSVVVVVLRVRCG
jgi:hypothetical protein